MEKYKYIVFILSAAPLAVFVKYPYSIIFLIIQIITLIIHIKNCLK